MSGSKKDSVVKIYSDPQASSTPERKSSSSTPKARLLEAGVQASVVTKEGETQVESKDTAQADAEKYMYEDEYPAGYWKELAEKRREALEASLLENEELHTSLDLVNAEKSFLEQENDGLKEMAEQAEELAKIVKAVRKLSINCKSLREAKELEISRIGAEGAGRDSLNTTRDSGNRSRTQLKLEMTKLPQFSGAFSHLPFITVTGCSGQNMEYKGSA